jgi:crossover junction endodeoxyribonuclease RuvC
MTSNLAGRIILGIDPGLIKTGWGVIEKNGLDITYIDCGIIRTESNAKMEVRLVTIFRSVGEIIQKYRPAEVAMEEVFINGNPKTSEKLVMARTAAYLAIALAGYPINEFKPNEIKKNVTGSGHADKERVYLMVKQILKIPSVPRNASVWGSGSDQFDALAIALCLAFEIPDP